MDLCSLCGHALCHQCGGCTNAECEVGSCSDPDGDHDWYWDDGWDDGYPEEDV